MADNISLRAGTITEFENGVNQDSENANDLRNSQASKNMVESENHKDKKLSSARKSRKNHAISEDESESSSDSNSEGNSSDSDSESSENESDKNHRHKVVRSVHSETIGIRNGLSDDEEPSVNISQASERSGTYRRFDPLRTSKPTASMPKDLAKSVGKYFSAYIPDSTLQESILDTAPVPSCEGIGVPQTDDFVYPILEELGKSAEKSAEKGIITAQKRMIHTMGPLYKMWTILESIKNQAHTGNIDTLDIFQMLDLTEKSMCCVGQANLALTHHRRMNICVKIKGDSKEGSKMLKNSETKLANDGQSLFGTLFEKDMQKAVKRAEKAKQFVTLLKKGQMKRKVKHQSRDSINRKRFRPEVSYANRNRNYEWKPFRSQPSNGRITI